MKKRRQNIFINACIPEKEIGKGKGCSIETINEKNVYAWAENDGLVFINVKGEKKMLGKGNLPVIKALNNELVICIWQNEKEIHSAIFLIIRLRTTAFK